MKNSTYLSFSSDGSTDGAHHGVVNLCYVHPNHGSFVLSTREIQGTNETAVAGASAIKEKLLEVTGGDLGRVSSLAFDTCSTQLAIFKIMKHDDDLRHVITVLCDAHGLNLFLKYVFKLPRFAKVLEDANLIAVAFARSNQQYWLLQSFQKPLNNGRETAIQSAGDTRWITLNMLFKSLKKLKLALKEMVDDKRCTLAIEVKAVILDRSFWLHLNETVQVLTLFNNAIIESQSATARMHTVIPRWLRLRDGLLKLKTHSDVEAPIDEIINGSEEIRLSRRDARTITGFEERFKRQVNCHHYAAFHLDPSNVKIIPSAYEQEQVLKAFRRVTKSDDDYRQMKQHWFHFRRQIDEFSISNECWLDESMEDFWYGQSVITPLIVAYGFCLATTVANTTISERGFSSLKRVQTRLRSCLTLDRLDKLIYINMNAELAECDGNRVTAKRRRLDLAGITPSEYAEEEAARDQVYNELKSTISTFKYTAEETQDGDDELNNSSQYNYLSFTDLCT